MITARFTLQGVLQLDQIDMAVFFCYLVKVTCQVYVTVHGHTGQVTFLSFYKVPETHSHVKLVTLYTAQNLMSDKETNVGYRIQNMM